MEECLKEKILERAYSSKMNQKVLSSVCPHGLFTESVQKHFRIQDKLLTYEQAKNLFEQNNSTICFLCQFFIKEDDENFQQQSTCIG